MGCFALILAAIGFMFLGVTATVPVQEPMTPQPVIIEYSEIPQSRTADGAFVLGYDDAPVTIVAFEDFLCPHCQNYQPTVHSFIQEYVVTGQAKFEFRMLPISQQSFAVFGMVECSEELSQGSFWDAHDEMFRITSSSQLSQESVVTFADNMNLDFDALVTCIETAEQAQIDMALAAEYSEVTGTPSVGWRLNDGELRFDIIPRQPTVEQIGALIDFAAQQ